MSKHLRLGGDNILLNELEEENQLNPKQNGNPKRKRNFIKEYVADYMNNSNLHGLKYIGQKELTFVEKIFWLCVFICSVILCAVMIRKVWIKWNITPVIITFVENPTPVWQIPYPAVTVCLEMKAKQRKFNFTEHYHLYRDKKAYNNLTEKMRNLYEDVSMVCDDQFVPSDGRKFADPTETINNIKEVSPNLTEAFFGFLWQDTASENSSDIIQPIITEEGLCYTFNILSAEDLFRTENLNTDYQYLEQNRKTESWSLDGGYAPDTPIETYPHRGSGFGMKSGLILVLKSISDDQDYLCRGPVQGVKVLLHNPAELPRLSQKYFRAPLSQAIVVSVKPKMVTTSEGLRSYDPERRQCYFQDERYLRYFKIYTQRNCEAECVANFTYTRCGCVHFGMPHAQEMPVCSSGSIACIKKARMELVSVEVQSAMDYKTWDTDELNVAREVAQRCKCLPACTSIEYEAETSQADYDFYALARAYRTELREEWLNLGISQVLIYFKEAQFVTYRRSELYGLTDFLANCGGLLGLFMGFSIMSIIEIFYFLSLRPWCFYRQGRNTESAKDEFTKS